ncbi:MAG: T9SS type B sorting domain-containing protein, partial [Paludibacteraceae bacterium]|nr:T9SS type B sorting domain-containing protein [Paludibacteraceae bacterium]
MTKLRHITTILLILLSAMTADVLAADFTTEGKTFWLSFMGLTDGYLKGAGGNIEPFVLVASKNDCQGTIVNPATGWNKAFTVEANKVTRIDIPQEQGYCDAEGVDTVGYYNKGLMLTTSDTASVYIGNYQPYSFDASVVLPIQSLGTDYRIACYNSSARGTFCAVATDDNTVVDITFSAQVYNSADEIFRPGSTHSFTLNKGQALMVAGRELLGTRVHSNDCKPIALFSGNYCPYIPDDCPACDVLVEQIPPMRAWGKRFIVSPTVERERDSRIIVQPKEAATVHVSVAGEDTTVTLDGNEFYEFEVGDSPANVSADFPIAVTQYAIGGTCSGLGDPFMIWVNPLEQAVRKSVFSPCPSAHINNHYVQVIVPTSAVALTRLDDNLISDRFKPIPANRDYSSARILITPQPHTISNDSGLMAYVYGYSDMSSDDYSYESYGYFTGTSVNNMEDVAYIPDEVHQYTSNDMFMFDREIRSEFINVNWRLNGKDLDVDGSSEPVYTVEIPMSELREGRNTIDMIINRTCIQDVISYSFYFTICPPIETPRFFTPNGDGDNDNFVIKNFDCYTSASVRIYDRFGKEIAKYPSSVNAWDGKYNGDAMP